MKTNFNHLIYLFICLLTLSACSSSNDNDDDNQTTNGFSVGNDFYSGTYVYLNDENIENDNPSDLAIILSDTFLLEDNIDSGINYMYVDYRGVDFEAGDKTLLDYRITENCSRVNGFMQGGTRLLDNTFNSGLNATQISFTINSVTDTTVDFEFSFTREDGTIISGQYSGNYTNVSE